MQNPKSLFAYLAYSAVCSLAFKPNFPKPPGLCYVATMKTLTISEAARDLANWLKQAVAGEEIRIQGDNAIVALRPLRPDGSTPAASLSPRDALRQLQQAAHLSPAEADNYLREVHAERVAAEKRSA